MKIVLKTISFLALIAVILFSGWKFGREIEKQADFGLEYLGMEKKKLIEEFGNPDTIKVFKISETNDEFQSAFQKFIDECNSDEDVTFLQYNKFWYDYKFWLIENNGEENVILVR